ncbi:tetratricopeptide repeat protein [Prosthecobacter sp. SYSU 5D2]|uniref:tetratricopeptide repeat protein n=1 Tax=Prosthecobacter sp. SYSU 5D2 TaxID=3134134 RepID=UPI0031FF030D
MKKRRQDASPPQTPPPPSGGGEPAQGGMKMAGFVIAMVAVVGLIGWAMWPKKNYTPVPVAATVKGGPTKKKIEPFVMRDEKEAYAEYAGSQSCKECHAGEFEKWESSNHGLAERLPDDKLDLAGFEPPQAFKHGTQTTEARKKDGIYEILSLGFGGEKEAYPVQRVIGHEPLRQFLVEGERGRLHAMEACYDPKVRDWFNVYGDEDRVPGEWGHWTGRGMVWNQMCASCHNTRVRKNYDLETDSYRTSMTELTVSCESCHGPMKAHDDWQREYKDSGKKDPTLVEWSRDQHVENCAGCHARRGEITGDFVPGDSFWDHYLLTITDHTDVYYPDGQIRDENYEFASFFSSRMYHAGVRCMDCHDMHSMKTVLPGNNLCMRCHTPGGFPNAPVILPEMHSFHQAKSTGNECINCHMPQTTYMQRDPRHDHGFTIPDPLLTKEYGVPNACNKCHTDQTVDWALEATNQWYGEKMNRKTRTRAITIAKARQGNPEARDELLALLESDEIPHWKASATLLLDRWMSEPQVQQAVAKQLEHEHPLVRQSAARMLEPVLQESSLRQATEKLLEDPVRSVRVTAAWSLRDRLNLDSAAGMDLQHMLRLNADQPSGQMQMGQFYYAIRDVPRAIKHMQTAIDWDPNSPPFHHDLAMLYSAAGNTPKVIEKLRDAIKLAPNEGQYHYELGLALSETGDMEATVAALKECVRVAPMYARAWYNLGLALNGLGRTAEAMDALRRGEAADPRDPGIPYARATILAQLGQKQEAIAATQKALSINPGFQEARQLLMMLSR